jgi:hypothetical protein
LGQPYFLYTGTVLEVLSVILVIAGVDEKLKAFGKPGLIKSILNYFRAFPRNSMPRIANISAHVSARGNAYASGHRTAEVDKMTEKELRRYTG